MKKSILLLAIAAGAGFSTMAQTARHFDSDALKPTEGAVTTEIGLTGGLFNSDFKLADGGLLKFRYFVKEDLALRMGLNITHDGDLKKFHKSDNTAYGTIQNHDLHLGVNLGLEKHFTGTRNLSPYVGGDITFGANIISEIGTDVDYDLPGMYKAGYSYQSNGSNHLAFGIRGIVGADFYVMKHVYIGAELGLGLAFGWDLDQKIDINKPNTTRTHVMKATNAQLTTTPAISTGVRIGFVF